MCLLQSFSLRLFPFFRAELYNQTGDGAAEGAVDFDYDGYALNVAAAFPAVVARLRTALIAAVLSWY